jgi:hypothetical protein
MEYALCVTGILLFGNLIISCICGEKSWIGKLLSMLILLIKNMKKKKQNNLEVKLDLLPERSIIRLINTGETEEEYIKRNLNEIESIVKENIYYGSLEYAKDNGKIIKKEDGIYVKYIIMSISERRLIPFYCNNDIKYFLLKHGAEMGYYNGMSFNEFVKVFNIDI